MKFFIASAVLLLLPLACIAQGNLCIKNPETSAHNVLPVEDVSKLPGSVYDTEGEVGIYLMATGAEDDTAVLNVHKFSSPLPKDRETSFLIEGPDDLVVTAVPSGLAARFRFEGDDSITQNAPGVFTVVTVGWGLHDAFSMYPISDPDPVTVTMIHTPAGNVDDFSHVQVRKGNSGNFFERVDSTTFIIDKCGVDMNP